MNNTDNNEKINARILQCKADILRARNIIASKKKEISQESVLQQAVEIKPQVESGQSQQTPPLPLEQIDRTDMDKQFEPERPTTKQKDIPEAKVEHITEFNEGREQPAEVEQEKVRIPKFDLAEEIMAEQRKITAIRRKAPGERDEVQSQEQQVESIGPTVEQPLPVPTEQEYIIAEIVALDIERLRRSKNP